MKFKVEDQYAMEWVHSNLPEAPLPDCRLEVDDRPAFKGWEWWTIEVESLEDLLALAKRRITEMEKREGLASERKWKVESEAYYKCGCNIFINVEDMRIVFTNLSEPE